MENDKWETIYMQSPTEFNKKAFDARLEYEKIMIRYYDRPNKPSLSPEIGRRMIDFANRYGTTMQEMIDILPAVEKELKILGLDQQ